ncbi:head-tail connector protein [Novosphingobium fluoreni]
MTIETVRSFLRYDGVDEDEALTIMLGAAIGWVERSTGILMTSREVTQETMFGPVMSLQWGPYKAETLQVQYLDASLATQQFTDLVVQPSGRLVPASGWPRARVATLAYIAGHEDPSTVPMPLIHAACIYCSLADQSRGDISASGWQTLRNVLGDYWRPVIA